MLNFSVFSSSLLTIFYSNNKKVSHLKITFKAVFGFGDARIQNRGISRRVFFVVTISLSLESELESCLKMFHEEDFLGAFLFHQHKVYSTSSPFNFNVSDVKCNGQEHAYSKGTR